MYSEQVLSKDHGPNMRQKPRLTNIRLPHFSLSRTYLLSAFLRDFHYHTTLPSSHTPTLPHEHLSRLTTTNTTSKSRARPLRRFRHHVSRRLPSCHLLRGARSSRGSQEACNTATTASNGADGHKRIIIHDIREATAMSAETANVATTVKQRPWQHFSGLRQITKQQPTTDARARQVMQQRDMHSDEHTAGQGHDRSANCRNAC